MEKQFEWNPVQGERGILTGCDENQEWMLKWWWEHYRQHNHLPVTFFDFGLSQSARRWCEKRGKTVSVDLPPTLVKQKKCFPKKVQKQWEKLYSLELWRARKGWLSKPFAFLLSTYKYAVWMDVDCQVRRPLDPLFATPLGKDGLAATREVQRAVDHARRCGALLPEEKAYNTGVIFFRHGAPVMTKWAENTYHRSDQFMGDGEVFNRTLLENHFEPNELSAVYNRHVRDGVTPDTVIVHYVCSGGKHLILKSLTTSHPKKSLN